MGRHQAWIKVLAYGAMLLYICLVGAYLADSSWDLAAVSLQSLASVVSIVTSVLLFVIAVLAYNKFTSSQLLRDSQTKAVIGLVQLIGGIKFYYLYQEQKNTRRTVYPLRHSPMMTIFNFKQEATVTRTADVLSKVHPAEIDVYDLHKNLTDYGQNIHVPKELAKLLKDNFKGNTYSFATGVRPDALQSPIHVAGRFERGSGEEDLLAGGRRHTALSSIDDKPFVLSELLEKMQVVYVVACKWLRDNNQQVYAELNIAEVEGKD